MKQILDWCSSIVGPCTVVSGDERFHGRTSVCRLRSPSGYCYVKIHRERPSWETEVHGYERWAPAFGSCAPRLLAVHEDGPFVLLVSELDGELMDNKRLTVSQEEAAWHDAGEALAALHGLAQGEGFGPCKRDGTSVGVPIRDVTEYVLAELVRQSDICRNAGCLSKEEWAVVHTAQEMASAFAGERPIPCHRDYGPANWLVTDDGVWAGVIDFEFAYWDVRVADFSRYPNWEWIHRPDLLEAFFDGYGRRLTAKEEQQLLVARVQYALSAINWGREHSYLGFVEEGRQALEYLLRLTQ
jgi:Ser/Thr protein kinase RdoA (MazF antagonist)